MDDIRQPQHLRRRDYTVPAGRPAAPRPHHQPQQTVHHYAAPQAQPSAPTAHHPPQQLPVHHRPAAQIHHQPTQPHSQPTAAISRAAPKRVRSGKKLTIAAGVLLAAAAIFGAGYLLKGSSDAKGIPASITRQVNYDLYFPSPMPAGYTYMKDTATFQIGQVFYKFAKGKKRVTVNEQPMPDPKPDLDKLSGYTKFTSPIGPAAIGTVVGQPTAVVLTPTTVITMHCIGGVTVDDLKTAISNLKNIGENPRH